MQGTSRNKKCFQSVWCQEHVALEPMLRPLLAAAGGLLGLGRQFTMRYISSAGSSSYQHTRGLRLHHQHSADSLGFSNSFKKGKAAVSVLEHGHPQGAWKCRANPAADCVAAGAGGACPLLPSTEHAAADTPGYFDAPGATASLLHMPHTQLGQRPWHLRSTWLEWRGAPAAGGDGVLRNRPVPGYAGQQQVCRHTKEVAQGNRGHAGSECQQHRVMCSRQGLMTMCPGMHAGRATCVNWLPAFCLTTSP